MNIIITFALATIMILPAGMAFAQNKPVSTRIPSVHSGGMKNSNLRQVSMRIRDQKRQIAMELKGGKITKEQAKAARLGLKETKKKELEFRRQNHNKELTADQKGHLDKMLDDNAGPK